MLLRLSRIGSLEGHMTIRRLALVLAMFVIAVPTEAPAQVCPGTTVTTGLRIPLGIAQSELGNLIVSETGTAVRHSGRISFLSPDGTRRTFIDGLPSGAERHR
jgi:hypothetical protein